MELHTTLTLLIVVASFSRMTSGEDAPGGRRPGGSDTHNPGIAICSPNCVQILKDRDRKGFFAR